MFLGYRGQANVYDGRCFVAHTTCCVLFAHMRCNFIKIVTAGITNLRMRMVFVCCEVIPKYDYGCANGFDYKCYADASDLI